jgi:hypothetical protein
MKPPTQLIYANEILNIIQEDAQTPMFNGSFLHSRQIESVEVLNNWWMDKENIV